jgi:hypothetical protein
VSDLPVPGSVWRDKTPAGNWSSPNVSPMRRVVEVISANGPSFSNSRVQGVSFWQEVHEGVWVDQDGPGCRRRTSILRRAFLTKFEHVRGPEQSPEVQR